MSLFFSLLLTGVVTIASWLMPGFVTGAIAFVSPNLSIPSSPTITFESAAATVVWRQPAIPATLPGLGKAFAGKTPVLGVKDGQLQPCASSPNCVVSQGEPDASHKVAPIEYEGDRATAHDALMQVLADQPRTEIVEDSDDYVRTEVTSRLLGFVDDVEFYLPDDESVIHVRSASRLGESDLGVNRDRVETIRAEMAAALLGEPATSDAAEA